MFQTFLVNLEVMDNKVDSREVVAKTTSILTFNRLWVNLSMEDQVTDQNHQLDHQANPAYQRVNLESHPILSEGGGGEAQLASWTKFQSTQPHFRFQLNSCQCLTFRSRKLINLISEFANYSITYADWDFSRREFQQVKILHLPTLYFPLHD